MGGVALRRGARPIVWRAGSARRCGKAFKMAKVLPSTLRREPWKPGYVSRGGAGMAILCPTEKGTGGGPAIVPVISSPGEDPWRYLILFSVEPCLSPVLPWRYVTAVGCRILQIATSLFPPMPTSLCPPLPRPDDSCFRPRSGAVISLGIPGIRRKRMGLPRRA